MLNRRQALVSLAATAAFAGSLATTGSALAQSATGAAVPGTGGSGEPFTLPDLPYAANALAPVIDEETMMLHHDKHHNAYVEALNKAVEADSALQGLSLEEIVASAGTRSPTVRNNGGGHWNHSFFWELMAAPGEGGEPSAELSAAIDAVFGSMDAFKTAFQTAGTGRFGSGWAWLIVNEANELEIVSTPNQDNPLMDVAETPGTPILGNDVWEHAYYLTYRNRRAEYLGKWWDVVNWTRVSEHYAAALAG